MSAMNNDTGPHSKVNASLAWLTVVTAIGLTATAMFVAKKVKVAAHSAMIDDLVGVCDRAAKALDDRIGSGEIAYAAS